MEEIYKIESTNYTLTLRATHIKDRFPIAYASIEIEDKDGLKIGKLVGMIRRQEFKGMGICKDLLIERLKLCRILGCDKAYSAVYYKRTGLIKLYKELGFEEIEPLSSEYVRFEKLLKEE